MFYYFQKVNKGHLNMKMSTIKNYHFNKIIKRAATIFQSPVLSQKLIRNVCHTAR